jgi:phosphoribosylaminoimidazole-succinocarboxamide synthase
MVFGFQPQLLQTRRGLRRQVVHSGSSKIVYGGPHPGTYVLCFKDIVNAKDDPVQGRGAINNRLSELFMVRLGEMGIANHFLKRLNMHEQLVRVAEPLPFRVVLHNVAFGTFAKRMGLEDGTLLQDFIPEFHTKPLEGQSLVSDRHITTLGWIGGEELDFLYQTLQRIHDFLNGQFLAVGIRLMRYRLEFGRLYLSDLADENQLALIDEVSLDTCQVMDIRTGKRLDMHNPYVDRHTAHLLYQEMAYRFGILQPGGPADLGD